MCNNHFSYYLNFQLLLTFSGTRSDVTNFAIFAWKKSNFFLTDLLTKKKKKVQQLLKKQFACSHCPWRSSQSHLGAPWRCFSICRNLEPRWVEWKKNKSPNRWKITFNSWWWLQTMQLKNLFFQFFFPDSAEREHVMRLSRAFLNSKVQTALLRSPELRLIWRLYKSTVGLMFFTFPWF